MENFIQVLKAGGLTGIHGNTMYKKFNNKNEYNCIDMSISINSNKINREWITVINEYMDELNKSLFENHLVKYNYTMHMYFTIEIGKDNGEVNIYFTFEDNRIAIDEYSFCELFKKEIRELKISNLINEESNSI